MTDIITESIGLYIPELDPRDEEQLFQESRLEIIQQSKGLINDFSEGSPISALLRGLVFAGSEIQYRNQQILLALVLKYLEVSGKTRQLGSKATAQLKFTLTTYFNYPFFIDAGILVQTNSGIQFVVTQNTVIPVGVVEYFVPVEAINIGDSSNVDPFTINNLVTPLSFVASVTNPEPAQGGTNEESIEFAIEKALTQLRIKALSSAVSYRDAAIEILGVNSKVKVVPFLAGDKASIAKGIVHIFCTDNNYQPINNAQSLTIFRALNSRIQAGTTLIVSPVELQVTEGFLIAKLKESAIPENAANLIWDAYQKAFRQLEPGDSLIINKIEFTISLTNQIDFIEELRINDNVLVIAANSEYSLFDPYFLRLELVTSSNESFVFNKGQLEPENYNPF